MKKILLSYAAICLFSVSVFAQDADISSHIRKLDAKWTKSINDGNAEAVANLFAEDGRIFPSNAAQIVGRDAIQKYAESVSSLPNLDFVTIPDAILASSSQDYAYLTGKYEMAFDSENGRIKDVGKYVVIWRNSNEGWQVVVDTFTSDLP